MPAIDFVYDDECPNVEAARANLAHALAARGLPRDWQEHRIGDSAAPDRVRGFGSPTILVDGKDIAGSEPGAGVCCRIYAASGGVPSVELIESALAESLAGRGATEPATPWRAFAALGGIGAALLPSVACPACWPAYAGVLSAMGVGALMSDTWVMPVTLAGLALALGALAWRARDRRGFPPLLLGLIAATAVFVGKFGVSRNELIYAGAGLLVAASVWNAWPVRHGSCPRCPGPGATRC